MYVSFLTFEMIKGKTGVGLCIRLLTLENSVHTFIISLRIEAMAALHMLKVKKSFFYTPTTELRYFDTDQLILTKRKILFLLSNIIILNNIK